ncbi:hypothetical protein L9F63_003807, partial [Diploptera punctata]
PKGKGNIRTLAVLDLESKRHYWLTVFAQDHGVVPLHARLEVFIAVENENDNIPLTLEPVYYTSVPENTPSGKLVVELKAEDYDLDPSQRLTFQITSGNPYGSFSINPDTVVTVMKSYKSCRQELKENIRTVISNISKQELNSCGVIITVSDIPRALFHTQICFT